MLIRNSESVSADLILKLNSLKPSGYGLAFADCFDAKAVLNDLFLSYLPFVKPTRIKPDGYSKIRDRIIINQFIGSEQ